MIVPYLEEEILKRERRNRAPLIGYITPGGEILDFSMLIGPYGHDNWRNPVTPTFLSYISYVIKRTDVSQFINLKLDKESKLYNKNKYDGFKEIVKRGMWISYECNHDSYEEFIQELKQEYEKEKEEVIEASNRWDTYPFYNAYDELKFKLLEFFMRLYSRKDFFYSLGRVIYATREEDAFDILGIDPDDCDINMQDRIYWEWLVVELMGYFKEICVRYLGYDAIERAMPRKDFINDNNIWDAASGYEFTSNPTIITTSCPNPNERLYNFQINGWTINRVPRMLWNNEEGRFQEENPVTFFHQTDKEEILGKEIQALKRCIPKSELPKYYR